jgi:hypothetical protein
MAASIRALPGIGEPHIVTGWRVGEEGRKRFAASALYSVEGEFLAVARSTWIVPAATERDRGPEG